MCAFIDSGEINGKFGGFEYARNAGPNVFARPIVNGPRTPAKPIRRSVFGRTVVCNIQWIAIEDLGMRS